MMHLSRDEADSIQRERGRVVVSTKLVKVQPQPGRMGLLALTEIVAGNIVLIPRREMG